MRLKLLILFAFISFSGQAQQLKKSQVRVSYGLGDDNGSVVVDSSQLTTRLWHQKGMDSLSALISGGGLSWADTNVLVTQAQLNDTAAAIRAAGGGGGTPGGSTTQVQYNNAGAFAGISGATTDGTSLTLKELTDVNINALGVTQSSTKGLVLSNNTAAAAGAQQISPAIRWKGQGWKTQATAASQSVEFRADVLPVQGSGNPSGTWQLSSSINGGAYGNLLTYTSAGALSVPSSITSSSITANTVLIAGSAEQVLHASTGSATQTWVGSSNTYITKNRFSQNSGVSPGVNFGFITNEFLQTGNVTTATSGAHPFMSQIGIKPIVINANATTPASVTNAATVYIEGAATGTATITNNYALWVDDGTSRFDGKVHFDNTITAGGTTGNQTINKPAGTVNIAAAGTTVTVTNSFCTTSSIVYAVLRTSDATATSIASVVPGSGSFVINLNAAATAEVSIGFIVYN